MRKDCYNKILNDGRDPENPHSFRQPYHVLFSYTYRRLHGFKLIYRRMLNHTVLSNDQILLFMSQKEMLYYQFRYFNERKRMS